MKLKELREQRAEKAEALVRLARLVETEDRALTDDERGNWDTLDGDIKDLDGRIAVLSRADDVESEQRRVANNPGVGRGDVNLSAGNTGDENEERQSGERREVTEEHRSLALNAWFRRNGSEQLDLTDEQQDACRRVGLNPKSRQLRIMLPRSDRFKRMQREGWGGGHGRSYAGAEERALSGVTGSAGALTVPESMVNALEVNMLAFGGILQAADIIRTASGEPMPWPTADDTSNTGEQVGESVAVTEADPTFASITWNAYKFSSKEIKVPSELLQDSMFDLPGVIGQMLGERLGRIQNTKFTTGNGAGTPKGLTVAATTGKTTSSATAITWDEIEDLIHTVDPAYRTGASFMFHDNVFLALKKLKDGQGRPLWAEGPNSTPPPTLRGYPYFINQEMSSTITSGDITMTFGQHNKYKVRQVSDILFYRLVERHRENDQDAFLAFVRSDGNLLDAGTAPVKTMVQA